MALLLAQLACNAGSPLPAPLLFLSLVGNRLVNAARAVHSNGYGVANDRGRVKRERRRYNALPKVLLITSVSSNRISTAHVVFHDGRRPF